MPKLPVLTSRELVRALERAGFVRWRQKGSHLTLYRGQDRRALTVPIHFAKTTPKGTLQSILKQAGLTASDLASPLVSANVLTLSHQPAWNQTPALLHP